MAAAGVKAWEVFGEIGLSGLGAAVQQLNLFDTRAGSSGAAVGDLREAAVDASRGIVDSFTGVSGAMGQAANAAQAAARKSIGSWQEFLAARLAGYRQEEGSHQAAMKRAAAEWRALKQTAAVGKDTGGALKDVAAGADKAADGLDGVSVTGKRAGRGLTEAQIAAKAAANRFDMIQSTSHAAGRALDFLGMGGGRATNMLASLFRVVGSAAGIFSGLQTSAATATGGLAAGGGAAGTMTGMLTGLSAAAVVTGAAIVALGIGIGIWAAQAVGEFMRFDDAMTTSISIMGDLSDVMRTDMEMAARDVAKSTRFSASQAAEAFYFLGSAGLDAEQAMAALPITAKFATAGNFDLARSTSLLSDSQSALGLRAEDAQTNLENLTRVADVLTEANIAANASVQEFSEALTTKAGARMRVLNKDVEEGVAVLAAFADQGVKGALAGERFNIILRDLPRVAVQNADAFKRYNIEVFDSAGNLRNMADITAEFERALMGKTDATRADMYAQMALNEQLADGISTLIGTSDKIREYEARLRDAQGVTEELAEKQLSSLAAQWDIVKAKVTDNEYAFGKLVHGVIATTIEFLDDLADLSNLVASGMDAMGRAGESAAPKLDYTKASVKDLEDEIDRLNDKMDESKEKAGFWSQSLQAAWWFLTGRGAPSGSLADQIETSVQQMDARAALARAQAAENEAYRRTMDPNYWQNYYQTGIDDANARREAEEQFRRDQQSWALEAARIQASGDSAARARFLGMLRERLSGLAMYSEEWKQTMSEIMQIESAQRRESASQARQRANEARQEEKRAARERLELEKEWLSFRVESGQIGVQARLAQIQQELTAATAGSRAQLDLLREQRTLQQKVQQEEASWLQYRVQIGEVSKQERIRQINTELEAMRAANQMQSAEALKLLQERNNIAAELTNQQIATARELGKKHKEAAIEALQAWKQTLTTLGQLTPALTQEIDTAISDIGDNTTRKTFNLRGELKQAGVALGRDLMQGLLTGSKDMADVVMDALISLMLNIVTKMAYVGLGIASPSRETAWMGRMLMEGLVLGMREGESDALRSAVGVSHDLVAALEDSFLGIATRAPDFGIADTIVREQERSVRAASALVDSLADVLAQPFAGFDPTELAHPALAGVRAFGYELAQRAAAGIAEGSAGMAAAWSNAVPAAVARMGFGTPGGAGLPGLRDGLSLQVPSDHLPPALTPFEASRDTQWIALLSESIITWQKRGGRL